MLEVGGVVYAAVEGAGVLRYDTSTGTALSTWSSANNLHSDRITHMITSGNQLLLGSPDNGLARFALLLASGCPLGTLEIGSPVMKLLVWPVLADLFILSGDSLHTYNTTNGVFATTYDLATLGLANDGASLLHWSATGGASPSVDALRWTTEAAI